MARRRKLARNHGWLNYFTDAQFDSAMFVYNEGSVHKKHLHERTLASLLREGFVVVEREFVKATPTLRRLVKAAADAEERGDD